MAEGRRGHIAKEVLSSERTYVKQLRVAVEVFLIPLRQAIDDNKPVIKTRYIQTIFSNIEDVLMVNTKFFGLLEQRMYEWAESPFLGDVFLEMLPEFDVYDKYLMEHHKTIYTVTELEKKSSWILFLQNAKEKPECENLELLALLITPVQRILRYKLLLEDLIKSTDKENPDYANLTRALEKILEKAAAVNESIKKTTNYEKLCQIQKSFITGNVKNLITEDRLFVREGALTKVCRKIPKKRWFFLFSDIVIYASLVGGQNAAQKNVYSFHRMINLSKVRVKSLEDTLEQKNAFQIMSNDKSFTVFADSSEEKEFWLMDMNELTVGSRLIEEKQAHLLTNIESAPVWIPDSNAEVCMLCKSAFTFIKRRHHCRNCGKCVCGPCSAGKMTLQHLEDKKPVRVCDICLRGSEPPQQPAQLTSSSSWSSISIAPSSPSSSPAFAYVPPEDAIQAAEPKRRIIGENSNRLSIISPKLPAKDGLASTSAPNIRAKLPLPPTNLRTSADDKAPPLPPKARNSIIASTESPPEASPPASPSPSTQRTTITPKSPALSSTSKSASLIAISPNKGPSSPLPSTPSSLVAKMQATPTRSQSAAQMPMLSPSQIQEQRKTLTARVPQKPVPTPPKQAAAAAPADPSSSSNNSGELNTVIKDIYGPDSLAEAPPLPPKRGKNDPPQKPINEQQNGKAQPDTTKSMLETEFIKERQMRMNLESEVRTLSRLLYKVAKFSNTTVSQLESLPVIDCVRVLSKRLEEDILTNGIDDGASSGNKKDAFALPPSRPPPTAPPSSPPR